MTPANGATCKRCGKPSDAKVFAFKANNEWDAPKGMHKGCAAEAGVEQAAQQGAQGLTTPEGPPTPPLTDKQKKDKETS